MNKETVLSVKDLTRRFGNFTAVDRITFQVMKGEIFGFLGANGAGKTTAMRMLCGLSYPTSGSGTVAGYDIVRQAEEIKRHRRQIKRLRLLFRRSKMKLCIERGRFCGKNSVEQ